MPYKKNKRQAFEAAQQAFVSMEDAFNQLDPDSPDFGHQTKLAEEELDKAGQVINKAYTTATEHQKNQLDQFYHELEKRKQDLME